MALASPFALLVTCLREGGLGFDAESLADTLWLAQFQPAPPSRVKTPGPDVPIESSKQSIAEPNRAPITPKDDGEEQPNDSPTPKPKPNDGTIFTGDLVASGGRRASAIQVPGTSALPGALELARALRPYNRRLPSAYRVELDEEATAESTAQFRFLRPVFRPVAARWFDVALLVDGARSMDPWLKTIDEFQLLLARHGAFGQVTRWRLAAGKEILLETSSGQQKTCASLADPRRRTLVLIVTNGVAGYWNGTQIANALAQWAKWAPVAMVQVFNERQWPHTALGPADCVVRATLPGAVNAKLEVERKSWESPLEDGSYVTVPIITLSPDAVRRWAEAAMAVGSERTPAAMFWPGVETELLADKAAEEFLSAEERVKHFQGFCTPEAFRLACYLAAVPLILPVMRIVQQEFIRPIRVEDLAQFIASGLIEIEHFPASDGLSLTEKRQDPDEVIYKFHDGVRDLLFGALPTGTAFEIKAKVEEQVKLFIERRVGFAIDNFRAFVLDEEGGYELPPSAQALVQVERELLRRMGFRGRSSAETVSKLTGKAEVAHRVYLRKEDPGLQRIVEALRSGLTAAGHEVVSTPSPVPDALLLLDAEESSVGGPAHERKVVTGLLNDYGVEPIFIGVHGNLGADVDFTDREHWQSSFEELLRRLDAIPLDGELVGLPELRDFFWTRPEHHAVCASIISDRQPTLVVGPGLQSFCSAIGRDPRVRRAFPGGIYWRPASYPTARKPVLLIDPPLKLYASIRPHDGLLLSNVSGGGNRKVITLGPLSLQQQAEFLGEDGFPTALQVPVLSEIVLLARWKRILRQYGLSRVEAWLSGRSVPADDFSQAMVFASGCAIALMPREQRDVLRQLSHASSRMPIRNADVAMKLARALDLISVTSGALRPEAHEAIRKAGHFWREDEGAEKKIDKSVFLCYRRREIDWAFPISQNLIDDGYDVFRTYNSLAIDDFETVISANITTRVHFLVVLTPSALEHCNDPGDWFRRAIETALQSRRNIVPLLLEDFDFATPAINRQLTGSLAELKHYHGLRVSAESFAKAMTRLREGLEQPAHPPNPSEGNEEQAAQEWFFRGFEAEDENLQEQLRCYSEAINLKPDYVDAFYNRALIRHEQGEVRSALADYDQVIRLSPGDADAYMNRGILRSDQGDVDGALHDYDEAIRLRPWDPEALVNRGVARSEQGDLEAALQDYNEAIRISPDYADAWYNRGIVRGDQGDLEGALEDYTVAIRINPGHQEALFNRASTRHAKDDLAGALEDYSEAIRLRPDDADALNNRGRVRSDLGDTAGALKDYTDAARITSNGIDLSTNLEALEKALVRNHPDAAISLNELEELQQLVAAYPQVAPLRERLANGLYSLLNDAQQEEAFDRRDMLLDNLRQLARAYPQDVAVREQLANGLYSTLNDAQQEGALDRRDALLEELRQLARSFSQDAAVRDQLANGLYNTLNVAKQEGALDRRDALLEELRQLAWSYPLDAAVRERLANVLYNTRNDAQQEGKFGLRDALLDELQQLARSHPQDDAIREQLANGLYNTLNDAKQEGALDRRDALLEELRQLAHAYPQDVAVREQLASGLYNTLNDAKQEEALDRRDALLEELRQLARAYPKDVAVRVRLAIGLFNTLEDAKQEEALDRRDALLEELRQLARAYPQDDAVREQLANGLYNTLNDAKQEEALDRRDALLEELRQLARAYPHDDAVREQLANGLYNTLNDAKEEEALDRRDALLEELRHLARAYPKNGAVREQLANGLYNTLNDAEQEGASDRHYALLEELGQLARAYPQDPALRAQLAIGLYNTLHHAKQEGEFGQRKALLDELQQLARSNPEDTVVGGFSEQSNSAEIAAGAGGLLKPPVEAVAAWARQHGASNPWDMGPKNWERCLFDLGFPGGNRNELAFEEDGKLKYQ